MPRHLFGIACLLLLLGGCDSSSQREIERLKQELATTQATLSEAQQQIDSIDNLIRQRIFSLIQSANNQLQSSDLQLPPLTDIHRELQLQTEHYRRLHTKGDHVSVTAEFVIDKLAQVMMQIRQTRASYDRLYNDCLAGMPQAANSQEISGMMCDVQADMARQPHQQKLRAMIGALLQVTQQQRQAGRRSNSSDVTPEKLNHRFQQLRDQLNLPES